MSPWAKMSRWDEEECLRRGQESPESAAVGTLGSKTRHSPRRMGGRGVEVGGPLVPSFATGLSEICLFQKQRKKERVTKLAASEAQGCGGGGGVAGGRKGVLEAPAFIVADSS